MKNTISTLFSLVFIASFMHSTAWAEVSANVAIQSDYVWRGISQNAEDPAIQGGFDYSHSTGIYAGIWGSSVDFSATESTEFDIYAGWNTELENGLGIDVGYLEYTYHGQSGANDSDFSEFYGGLSYNGFGIKYSIGDEFDDLLEVSYSHNFEAGVSFSATYADYDAYTYYTLGVSKEIQGLGFDLSYWDTDINNDELADGRLVLTVSKEF